MGYGEGTDENSADGGYDCGCVFLFYFGWVVFFGDCV